MEKSRYSMLSRILSILLILFVLGGMLDIMPELQAEAAAWTDTWSVIGDPAAAGPVSPYDIAVDNAGNVYVTNGLGVSKLPAGSSVWEHLPSTGLASNQTLDGIEVADNGDIYAITFNRVIKLAAGAATWDTVGGYTQYPVWIPESWVWGGQFTGWIKQPGYWSTGGSNLGGIFVPLGITIDNYNNVYVTNTGLIENPFDQRYTVTKKVGQDWSVIANRSIALGGFNTPSGITSDSSGIIYVTDEALYYVRKYVDGSWVDIGAGAANHPEEPTDIAVDSKGYVYVSSSDSIKVWDGAQWLSAFRWPNGRITYLDTYYPTRITGMDVDSSGNIYIVDRANNLVLKQQAPASQLTWETQPGGGIGNVAWQPANQPVLTLRDEFGRIETNDSISTVTISLNDANGAVLGGNKTVKLVNGRATFTDLMIDNLGTYTLTAVSSLGGGITSVSAGFIIEAPAKPVITGVSPGSCASRGGVMATINGSGFSGATAVLFGDNIVTNMTVVNDSVITAIIPAHEAGSVNVQVQTPYWTSDINPSVQVTYTANPPSIWVGDWVPITPVYSGLSYMADITVDSQGTLYALDSISGIIFKRPGGQTDWYNANNVSIGGAYGFGIDIFDTVYVACNYNYNTARLQGDGSTNLLPIEGAQWYSTDIAADSTGNLYATSEIKGGVKKLPKNGIAWEDISYNLGVGGTWSIAIDKWDNIYVTDSVSSRVFTLAKGSTTWQDITYGAAFSGLRNIAVNPEGNLYVTDNTSKIKEHIIGTTEWHELSISTGFLLPRGITFDKYGNLYVSDLANKTIKMHRAPATELRWHTEPAGYKDRVFYRQPVIKLADANGLAQDGDNLHKITLTLYSDNGAILSGTKTVTLVNGVASFTDLKIDKPGTYKLVATIDLDGISSVESAAFTIPNPPAPQVTSISPERTMMQGGSIVTITGNHLLEAYEVFFGDTSVAALTEVTDNSLKVRVPEHAVGEIDVVIRTPYGDSAAGAGSKFTFTEYGIDSIFPVSGQANGGTSVTITGKGLADVTEIYFGDVAVTNLNVINDTTITCTSPAHVSGTVNIYAKSGLTLSTANPDATYTFTGAKAGAWLGPWVNIPVYPAYTIKYAGALEFSPAGIMYFVDGYSSSIRRCERYDYWGYSNYSGHGTPSGIDFDSAGRLYYTANYVYIDTGYGFESMDWTTGYSGGHNYPSDIALDSADNVYTTSTGVKMLLKGSKQWTDISGSLSGLSTQGLCTDKWDNLYVGGSYPYGGVYVRAKGSNTWQNITYDIGFNGVNGLVVDNSGNLFASDYWREIVKVLPSGGTHWIEIYNRANSGTRGPKGLGFSPDGKLYVADYESIKYHSLPATGLEWVTQPVGSQAGTRLSQQPVLRLVDANGNVVQDNSCSVTLRLKDAGGTSLGGTTTVTLQNGVATFTDLTVDHDGTFTMAADFSYMNDQVEKPDSSTFVMTKGIPSVLEWQTQPSDGICGLALTQQPALILKDASGNIITDENSSTVTLSLTSPAGATLSGTKTVTFRNGAASFTGLSINKAGTYTFTVTTSLGGIAVSTSNSFTVAVGPPALLEWQIQPGNGASGVKLASQPVLVLKDAGGNIITDDNSSTVSVSLNAANGAVLSGTVEITVSGGIAVFTDLKIDKPGTYTLSPVSSLPDVAETNSVQFTVLGPPAALEWYVQPGGGIAGAGLSQQPTLKLVDEAGNLVEDNTSIVTLQVTGGDQTKLLGTKTATMNGGYAQFTDINITSAGNLTLTPSIDLPGITTPTSAVFKINHGPAYRFEWQTKPADTKAGEIIPIEIRLKDRYDNIITSDSSTIIGLEYIEHPIGYNPSIPMTTLQGGIVLRSIDYLEKPGKYTINFSSTNASLIFPENVTFNVAPGNPNKFVWQTQPGGAVSLEELSSAPVIKVTDAFDNTVTSYAGSATVSIKDNTSGAVVYGQKTVLFVNGVAAFNNLSMDKVGTYKLTAENSEFTSPASDSFSITHGEASGLVWQTQPGNGTGGTALSQQPVLALKDAGGNIVTGDNTSSVTVSLATPGGAALSGTKTVTVQNGVATFTDLRVDKIGVYILSPVSSLAGVSGTDSAEFTISAGSAVMLEWQIQPGNSTGGTVLSQQPALVLKDAGGNTVTGDNGSTVTVSLTTPGTATLSGTKTVTVQNGVAEFTDLKVDKIGAYTLSPVSSLTGVSKTDSAAFTISAGLAVTLEWQTQPGNGTGGTALSQQPVLVLKDAGGNTVSNDSSSTVTVGLTTANGASLSGTKTATVQNGIAIFTDLKVDKIGTYTLSPVSSLAEVSETDSNSFTISVGSAVTLEWQTQPGNGTGGTAISQQPALVLKDAGGNTVTGDNGSTVTVSLTTPGTATLSGTKTVAVQNGIATFTDLKVDKIGTYTLSPISSLAGVTETDSAAFTISEGSAVSLEWQTQPGNGTGGTVLAQQPVLVLKDAGGNVVTGDSSSTVTVNLTTASGAALSGATTVTVLNGAAVFTDLKVDKIGAYTLSPVSSLPGVSETDSNSFTISVGSAATLEWQTQPGNGTGGTAFTQQPVLVLKDAGGNTVVGDSGSTVTVSITTPGTATLYGTKTVTVQNGVATFKELKVDKSGIYTLSPVSSLPGVSKTDSNSFTISVGPAVTLEWQTQPGNGTGGTALAQQPALVLKDAGGNTVTGDNSSTVTVSLTTPGGATLSGTTTVTINNGSATFLDLKVDKIGTYTLSTVSSLMGVSETDSAGFTITAGPAATLEWQTQPGNGTGGTALTQQPALVLKDAGGNIVTNDSSSTVTVGLSTVGGATLSGTKTVTVQNGAATFTDLKVDKIGTYTLSPVSSLAGVSKTDSAGFAISMGPAVTLEWQTQPGNGTGGMALTQQPVLVLKDAGGNTVTGDSGSTVTVSLTTPGGATLSGTTTIVVKNGVAAFTELRVDKIGTYTLSPVSSLAEVSETDSAGFAISVGPAASLAWQTQPFNVGKSAVLSQQPVLLLIDAGGNVLTSDSTTTVTLSLTVPGEAVLSGNRTVTFINGIAAFMGLKVNKPGTYTLSGECSISGVTCPASSSFDITIGPPSRLVWHTQPGSGIAGEALTQQPVLLLEDENGNVIFDDSSSTVTLYLKDAGETALKGTVTVAFTNGEAVFTNLAIEKAGSYILTPVCSLNGITSPDSTSFSITANETTQVAWSVQPGSGTGGTALAIQPVLELKDAYGNTVSTDSTSTVTISLTTTGPATLSGTTTVTVQNGVAAFADLKVDKTGTYTLSPISSLMGVSETESNPFTISVGPAVTLIWQTQPGNGTGGTAFSQQPVLVLKDAGGNVVTNDSTSTVTLSLTTAREATLSGNKTTTVQNGIATFTDLEVDKIGTYTLSPVSSLTGVSETESADFTISVGPAVTMEWQTQPGNGTGGTALSQQPVLILKDAGGNTVTGDNSSSVTVRLTTPGSASLSGTTTVIIQNGAAIFIDLKVDKIGTYTLTPDSSVAGVSETDSNPFTISVGPAVGLSWIKQPGDGIIGNLLIQQPVLQLLDSGGNPVVSGSHSVTLTLVGGNEEIFSGSKTEMFINGQATFTNLSVGMTGKYKLVPSVSTPGVVSPQSAEFTIIMAQQGEPGGPGGPISPGGEDSDDVAVDINGASQTAGTSSTTEENGRSVTTVTLNDNKLQEMIEQNIQNSTLTVQVNTDSDETSVVLNGKSVSRMDDKNALLEVITQNVIYNLPASQINIDEVSSGFGENVNPEDIKISINIDVPSEETVRLVQDAADSYNLMLLVEPVEFTITCEYRGQSVEVSTFNAYVERLIAIPEGVDPATVTTAAVLSDDGKSFTQVPTVIVWIDGKAYAKFSSLSNSVYALVYNKVEFSDVSNHWAKDIINDMGSRMIINGIGNGSFNPERNITRAEFAAIICRALGLKGKTDSGRFKDITATDWYSSHIETAASYGIINGYSDGTFRPNEAITREQAMAMVYRAMKMTGLAPELSDSAISSLVDIFRDGSTVSEYARLGVAACLETGVINGRGAGMIAPRDCITRVETAVILHRLLSKSGLI